MKFDLNTLRWSYQSPVVASGGLFWNDDYQNTSLAPIACLNRVIEHSQSLIPPSGWDRYLSQMSEVGAGMNRDLRYSRFVGDNDNLVDLQDKSVYISDWKKELVRGPIGYMLQPRGNDNLFYEETNLEYVDDYNEIFNSINYNYRGWNIEGEWKPLPHGSGQIIEYEINHSSGTLEQYLDGEHIDSIVGIDDRYNKHFKSKYGFDFSVGINLFDETAEGIKGEIPVNIDILGVIHQRPIEKCGSCDWGFDNNLGKSCRECFGKGWLGIKPGDLKYYEFDVPYRIDFSNLNNGYINTQLNYLYGPEMGNGFLHIKASNDREVFGDITSNYNNVVVQNPYFPISLDVYKNVYDIMRDRWDVLQPGVTNCEFHQAVGSGNPFDEYYSFDWNQEQYAYPSGSWPANNLGYTPISKKHIDPFVNAFSRLYFGYWDKENGQAVVNDGYASVIKGSPVEWKYTLLEEEVPFDIKGYDSNLGRYKPSRLQPGNFYPLYKNNNDVKQIINSPNTEFYYSSASGQHTEGLFLGTNGSLYELLDYKLNLVPSGQLDFVGNTDFSRITDEMIGDKRVGIKNNTICLFGNNIKDGIDVEISASGIQDIVYPQEDTSSGHNDFYIPGVWIGKFDNEIYATHIKTGPIFGFRDNRVFYGDVVVGNEAKSFLYEPTTLDFTGIKDSSFQEILAIFYKPTEQKCYAITYGGVAELDFQNYNITKYPYDADSKEKVAGNKFDSFVKNETIYFSTYAYSDGIYRWYKLILGNEVLLEETNDPGDSDQVHSLQIKNDNVPVYLFQYAPNFEEIYTLRGYEKLVQIDTSIRIEKTKIPTSQPVDFLVSRFDVSKNTALPFFGDAYTYATANQIKSRSIPDNNLLRQTEHRSGSGIVDIELWNGEYDAFEAHIYSSELEIVPNFKHDSTNLNKVIEFGQGDKEPTLFTDGQGYGPVFLEDITVASGYRNTDSMDFFYEKNPNTTFVENEHDAIVQLNNGNYAGKSFQPFNYNQGGFYSFSVDDNVAVNASGLMYSYATLYQANNPSGVSINCLRSGYNKGYESSIENIDSDNNLSVYDYGTQWVREKPINYASNIINDNNIYPYLGSSQVPNDDLKIHCIQRSGTKVYINNKFSQSVDIPNFVGFDDHYLWSKDGSKLVAHEPFFGTNPSGLIYETGEAEEILFTNVKNGIYGPTLYKELSHRHIGLLPKYSPRDRSASSLASYFGILDDDSYLDYYNIKGNFYKSLTHKKNYFDVESINIEASGYVDDSYDYSRPWAMDVGNNYTYVFYDIRKYEDIDPYTDGGKDTDKSILIKYDALQGVIVDSELLETRIKNSEGSNTTYSGHIYSLGDGNDGVVFLNASDLMSQTSSGGANDQGTSTIDATALFIDSLTDTKYQTRKTKTLNRRGSGRYSAQNNVISSFMNLCTSSFVLNDHYNGQTDSSMEYITANGSSLLYQEFTFDSYTHMVDGVSVTDYTVQTTSQSTQANTGYRTITGYHAYKEDSQDGFIYLLVGNFENNSWYILADDDYLFDNDTGSPDVSHPQSHSGVGFTSSNMPFGWLRSGSPFVWHKTPGIH